MLKCESCGIELAEWTTFCSKCGHKVWEEVNSNKKADNVEKVKNIIEDIAKSEKWTIVISYLKSLDKNQKIMTWLSALLIVDFFLPYVAWDSLFSFWGYAWLMFLIPIAIIAIQYCYTVMKKTDFHKLLWHIIILVLTTVVTTFNLVIFYAVSAFADMLRFLWGEVWLSLWFSVSLLGYIALFVFTILETLNIIKDKTASE